MSKTNQLASEIAWRHKAHLRRQSRYQRGFLHNCAIVLIAWGMVLSAVIAIVLVIRGVLAVWGN